MAQGIAQTFLSFREEKIFTRPTPYRVSAARWSYRNESSKHKDCCGGEKRNARPTPEHDRPLPLPTTASPGAYLCLCRLLFNCFRRLCLEIFFMRFFLTLPIRVMAPFVIVRSSHHPCSRTLWSDPATNLKKIASPFGFTMPVSPFPATNPSRHSDRLDDTQLRRSRLYTSPERRTRPAPSANCLPAAYVAPRINARNRRAS